MNEKAVGVSTASDGLEKYRIRLGFWRAIWGTLISGGVAVAIPAAVDAYKASLDLTKQRYEIELKRIELDLKKIESHNSYVSQFLSEANNQDIEVRLRFSEYFSYLSETEFAPQWATYNGKLSERRKQVRDEINENEQKLAKLQANHKPDIDDQIEIQRLRRELDWNYAEVGYARPDTNISLPDTLSSPNSINRQVVAGANEQAFRNFIVDKDRSEQLKAIVDKIVSNKDRYQKIEQATKVPWYVVGILHQIETEADFSRHLNGDPLTERTVHVPKGRPPQGSPPFTWEESAIDELNLERFNLSQFSTIGEVLFAIERFNGFGYRVHGVSSPYVWSCTNLYSSGAYVADKEFNPSTKVKYCGAAPILKLLMENKIIASQ